MAEAASLDRPIESGQVDRSFLWRRLHSLSGVLPLGGFLCYHLFENLAALRGPTAYNEMVNDVNTMLPRLYFFGVELGLILIPLAFHALYGVYIWSTGKQNASRYSYPSNWAYVMQRVSGVVALVYLAVHIGVLRGMVTLAGHHLAPADPAKVDKLDLVTYNDVAAHLGNATHMAVSSPFAGNHILALYVVGTLLTIYHFTNGLNGFSWTWGIAVGRVAQKRVQTVAWVLFVVLSAATLNILFKLRFAA
jgi:succinate dehydrogenase / fumarate reductase cytochrome b subunit